MTTPLTLADALREIATLAPKDRGGMTGSSGGDAVVDTIHAVLAILARVPPTPTPEPKEVMPDARSSKQLRMPVLPDATHVTPEGRDSVTNAPAAEPSETAQWSDASAEPSIGFEEIEDMYRTADIRRGDFPYDAIARNVLPVPPDALWEAATRIAVVHDGPPKAPWQVYLRGHWLANLGAEHAADALADALHTALAAQEGSP